MKSISQIPCGGQIPASEESGPILASRADCTCAIPAKSPEEHPVGCPVRTLDAPVPFGLVSSDLEVAGLPPIDWSNIQKDPRLEDLEALESHSAGCQCTPCWRATLRMSNHPELATTPP